MKTFILMWNPAISSFKKEEFEEMIYQKGCNFNWSVWDWKEAEEGDRFFMVRVGEGNTGIVMAGRFESGPWQGEDWSGKGREVYYVDLDVGTMLDSDKKPFISTAQLTEAIPDFDWTGGHSGRVLSDEAAIKLETLWMQYLYSNQSIFDDKDAFTYDCWNIDMIDGIIDEHLLATRDNTCEICGYNYQKLWGDDCENHNSYYIYWPGKLAPTNDDVMNHIHCVCDNCHFVNDKKLRARLGEPERDCEG